MLLELDQNTVAVMTAALEHVCKKLPAEKDSHESRKRIADAILACANAGHRAYDDFEDAGLDVLKEITQPTSFDWFGFRWLSSIAAAWLR